MAIVVNEYVFFDGKRFKVTKKLPRGKIRLIIGYTKAGVSTRDVLETEVSPLNPDRQVKFTTRGEFGQKALQYRYPK